MAEIVLGMGCAHTPQLHTPADKWEIRARRDTEDGVPLWYKGERMRYAEVEEKRKHLNLDDQTAMEIREERLQKSFEAIETLSAVYAEVQPDVTIIFGNDQQELFLDDIRPAFTIMGCQEFSNMPRTEAQKKRLPPGIELSDGGHLPDEETVTLPGHPQLAEFIASYVTERGFDVAWSKRQYHPDDSVAQTGGMPHSYGFIYKQIFRENLAPHIPIDTNTMFPPNQPTASRCIEFGKLVGNAVRAWDQDLRVAIIASGGLSHFVVDEDFDRDIMDAMQRNEFGHLLSYHEGYYQAGSSEIKSWIAMGAAILDSSLDGTIVDYRALYRTPAGTGSSAAFMYWR